MRACAGAEVPNIYVTGHSLGGALATLFTTTWCSANLDLNSQVRSHLRDPTAASAVFAQINPVTAADPSLLALYPTCVVGRLLSTDPAKLVLIPLPMRITVNVIPRARRHTW